ncbi:hypothetical protein C1645_816443 [Glomus cerebriforme]|uniref:Uncharacterized protein n=1 Tax=Glomus cerebriforme TaxID=658196 RepID=A0A397TBJ8_9GLOM|nr:hypothetical protein C1645_816443 [Glomus cerebriforme]
MNTNNQYNHQAPYNISQPRYSFFYQPYNDFQIYHITCEEIPHWEVTHLLNNMYNIPQNHVQPSNLHIFYYPSDDNKIYRIICEVVSVHMLNKKYYDIELPQQQVVFFSKEQRDNLIFNLERDYLSPQPIMDLMELD